MNEILHSVLFFVYAYQNDFLIAGIQQLENSTIEVCLIDILFECFFAYLLQLE